MRLIAYKFILVVICSILGASFFPAGAQTTTGEINGDVTDSSGGTVPNVTVTAESSETGTTRTTTTSGTGNYAFAQMPIGQL